MSTTPINPIPPDGPRDPDLTEPETTTPPDDGNPLIEETPEPGPDDEDPNAQLPRFV
jgi:hypothetical protein